MECSISKLGSMPKMVFKRRGGYLILELAFFFVVMAIIAAIALGMLGNTDGAKVTTANQELDQIRTAVMSYQTYRLDGAYPSNLGDLVQSPSISKAEAIDGRQHDAFLGANPRWTTAGLKDMWGNDYVLDESSKTIYSTAGSSDSSDYISVTLGTSNGN